MKKTAIITALLCLCILCSSCGIIIINKGRETETPENPNTTDSAPDTGIGGDTYKTVTETDGLGMSKDFVGNLPKADLNGMSVFIAADKKTGLLFSEEDSFYSAAVAQRDALVSVKYNTTIITMSKSADQLLKDVKAAEKSGDYYADFAVIPCYSLGNYQSSGYIRNLKALPYTDFSAEYFNGAAMKQTSAGSIIYAAVGEATAQIEHYSCLYFNKTLAADLGIVIDFGDIYSGNFTWETLAQLIKAVPEGKYAYGSCYDDDFTSIMAFSSTGQTFLSPDVRNFSVECNTEYTSKLISILKEILPLKTKNIKTERTVPAESGETGSITEKVTLTGIDMFKNGSMLFCFGSAGEMYELDAPGFAWGVLPLPKSDEKQQEYYSYVSENAPVITMLSSSQNIDTSGYILQALNAASFGYIQNEFCKKMMIDVISDVHTLDMLDIIRSNPVYDFALMFGDSSRALKNGTSSAFLTAVNKSNSFASQLSANSSALVSYLNSVS